MLEEKEEDEFMDSMHKEQVSKEIMERIREKKLREQNLSSDNNSSCDIKTVSLGNDQIHVETRSSASPTSQTELPNFPENEVFEAHSNSALSSTINIITEYQLRDPGSHPPAIETSYDSISPTNITT